MKCLFLTLKGNLRSWGTDSVGDDRPTGNFPTESAILGIGGACIGIDQNSSTQVKAWYGGFRVVTLSATSFINTNRSNNKQFCTPNILTDFQTVNSSLSMSNKIRQKPILSNREYITDGLDTAVIIARHQNAKQWIEQLALAVQQPSFTPYLGRKSNTFGTPLTEPGETAINITSIEKLCEILYHRLSKISIGHLRPNKCTLRVPIDLDNGKNNLCQKWRYKRTETINDSRSSAFRTFENRKTHLYTRTFEPLRS